MASSGLKAVLREKQGKQQKAWGYCLIIATKFSYSDFLK
jgi:hypothetical protein